MNPWYSISRKGDTATGRIFGELVPAEFDGQDAAEFLAEIGDASQVELRVMDCFGGNGSIAFGVIDGLKGRDVTVEILGRAYSAGQLLTLAASPGKIWCRADAQIMLHAPRKMLFGNVAEISAACEGLELMSWRLKALLAQRSGQPLATVATWLAADTYFTAEQALAVGLVDGILPPQPVEPRPESVAGGEQLSAVPNEQEAMFFAWLRAFGPITTTNKEQFGRNLADWFAGNVRELKETPCPTPRNKLKP